MRDVRKASLDAMFEPRRIGVVGVSRRSSSWGNIVVRSLLQGGFRGDVVVIGSHETVLGTTQADNVRAAGTLDILVIAVPKKGVYDIVKEGKETGVKTFIVFADGFAEVGNQGHDDQDRLLSMLGETLLLGPNCLGLVSAPTKVTLAVSAFASRVHRFGPVGIVSQSGALGFVLAEQLERRGVGYSYYASTGNEVNLEATEIAEYLLRRCDVSVVGMYLETVRSIVGFRQMAETAETLGKHVVVLKTGMTDVGAGATISHTAAIVGNRDSFETLCDETGVCLVKTEEEFVEAVHVLCEPRVLPRRPRICILTSSGGAGALLADQLDGMVEIPVLSPETRVALSELSTPVTASQNPVDMTGRLMKQIEQMDKILSILSHDIRVDAVVIFVSFGDQQVEGFRRIAGMVASAEIPAWMIWAGAPDNEVSNLAECGKVFGSISAFVRGLSAYPRESVIRSWTQWKGLGWRSARRDTTRTEILVDRFATGQKRLVVSEHEAAEVLVPLGLPYTKMVAGRKYETIVDDIRRLGLRAPWVVKIDHPQVAHRLDLGLIEKGVENNEQLGRVIKTFEGRCTALGLAVEDATFVVQEMVSGVASVAVGCVRDAVVGPVIVAGPGEADVESHVVQRGMAMYPVTSKGLGKLVDAMLSASGGKILVTECVRIIRALNDTIAMYPEIEEIDVNPILVESDGKARAVDSLFIVGGRT